MTRDEWEPEDEFDVTDQAEPRDASERTGEVESLIAKLYARQPENKVEPRLEPTAEVCHLLGDPQQVFGMIHLTGTNGKSSTARIISAILSSYGMNVGLFTSPHLLTFNERIEIGGEPISDQRLLDVWEDIEPYVDMVDDRLATQGKPRLTFFEVLTVIAYAAFADAPVDVAVVEVGMGGEWDSTNVADGDVAVFTPIAFDHTDRLGSTLAEIADTKAGIIKSDAIVVSAAQDDAVREVLREASARHDVPFQLEGVDFEAVDVQSAVGGQQLTVRGLTTTYPELLLPLLGDHQAQNAALAVAAVEAFLGGGSVALSQPVLEQGMLAAVSPGRLQLIATAPPVVADVAHNPHGAESLVRAVDQSFGFSKTVAVLAVLADKDAVGILHQLGQLCDTVVVTASDSPRALPVADLELLAVNVLGDDRVLSEPDVASALRQAFYLVEDDPSAGILVTGSVTTVADALGAVSQQWPPTDGDDQ